MKFLILKRVQLIIVLIFCLTIITAGSFAWFSVNQSVVNEFMWDPEFTWDPPGVNLHDDFSEPNKDVFVENSGNAPLLVRVKLREFMEYGSIEKTYIPAGASYDNLSLWHLHNHAGDCNEDFHNFWSWSMGGQKWYLPASANNTDAVVITPILPDGLPKTLQFVYSSYSNLEAQIAADPNAADLMSALDNAKNLLHSVSSSFPSQSDIDSARLILYSAQKKLNSYTKNNFNGLQLTRPATIITMQQWLSGSTANLPMQLGDFWVADTDGWFYWANPLEAGEATGLLLNSVDPTPQLADLKQNLTRYHYSVNVSLQAATAEDLDKFSDPSFANGTASVSAQTLLKLVANSITTIN